MTPEPAPPDLTEDAFLGGRVRILQPAKGYRAGVDAVLLAATVAARSWKPQHRVLDVGAGVGTVGLCIAARLAHAHVVLMEREPELSKLAARNVALNGLNDRVAVATARVGGTALELQSAQLEEQHYDDVVANPPYHSSGKGTSAPNAIKAASHEMPDADLDTWVRFMTRMAKPDGHATMVHKAEALALVLQAMRGRFGAIRVLPVYPRDGEPASRIIVRGTKGSRAPLQVLPPVVLHGAGNAFLPNAAAIFREATYLPLESEQAPARKDR